MGIKISNTDIADIRIGGVAALRVMRGGQEVWSAGDLTPPIVLSRTINAAGTVLALVFDKPVAWGSSGAIVGLAPGASGGLVTVSTATLATTNLSNDTIEWVLSRVVGAGESLTLDYTQPGAGIQDTVTPPNNLADFVGEIVDNQSEQTVVPQLIAASIDDAVLTLEASAALYNPNGEDIFSIATDYAAPISIASVSGYGSGALTVTLNRRVSDLETVSLSVANVPDGVQDANGSLLQDASDLAVAVLTQLDAATFPAGEGGLPSLATWEYKLRRTIAAAQNTRAGVGGHHVCILRSADNGLPAEFVEYVQSNGSDIRIRNAGGTAEFVYHVFKVDQASGDCVLVVEVPWASSGLAVTVDVFWGKTGATGQSSASVWRRDVSGGTFGQNYLGWLFDAGKASGKYAGFYDTFTELGTSSPAAGDISPARGASFNGAASQRLEWAAASKVAFAGGWLCGVDTSFTKGPDSVPVSFEPIGLNSPSNGVNGSEWAYGWTNDGSGGLQFRIYRGPGVYLYWPVSSDLIGKLCDVHVVCNYGAYSGTNIASHFATVSVHLATDYGVTVLDSSTPGAGYSGTLGTNAFFGAEIRVAVRNGTGIGAAYGDVQVAGRRCRAVTALSVLDFALERNLVNNMGSFSALTTVARNELFTAPPSGYPVVYNLADEARVSVGIYDDGKMVRQLVGNKLRAAGSNTEYWDGKDDLGNDVAAAIDCTFEVWEHNFDYASDSVSDDGVGNSSDIRYQGAVSGYNKVTCHRSFEQYWDMACTPSGKMYIATGFNEKQAQAVRIEDADTSYQRVSWVTFDNFFESLQMCDTDGARAYYVSNRIENSVGSGAKRFYVRAFDIDGASGQNDSQYTFAVGGYAIGAEYSVAGGGKGFLAGMCVQRSSNYLFVTRAAATSPGVWELEVYHKITGAPVNTFDVGGPCLLHIDPSTDDIIAVRADFDYLGDSVSSSELLRISGDFTATPTISVLASLGLARPLRVAVDPTGAFCVIVNGHPDHRVHAFSLADGTAYAAWATAGVYGVAGGIDATGGVVGGDTLLFHDRQDNRYWLHRGFATFDHNGRLFVGDPGNQRVLVLDAAGAYEDFVAYLHHFYASGVDVNDPSRWHANWLEYSVTHDVGNTNAHTAGWHLARNWSAGLSEATFLAKANGIVNMYTITRGPETRTYALIRVNGTSGSVAMRIYELPSASAMRYTGVAFREESRLYANGAIRWALYENASFTAIYERTLDSIDGSGNPVYGATAIVARIPRANPSTDPVYAFQFCDAWGGNLFDETSDGKFLVYDTERHGAFSYNPSDPTTPPTNVKYHGGMVARGGNAWEHKYSPSGYSRIMYELPFAHADYGEVDRETEYGQFDDHYNYAYGGNRVRACGVDIDGADLVIESFHGEFWPGNADSRQKNEYRVRTSTGVYLFSFGRTQKGDPWPLSAGNAFCPEVYIDPTDAATVLIVNCDENSASRLWRARIDTSSIARNSTGAVGAYVPPI